MDEIIQIKCPFDGAVLSVKNQPGIETKNVTCPICKHKYPFTQFKRIVSSTDNDPDTEYPVGNKYLDDDGERTSYEDNGGKTQICCFPNYTLGILKVVGTSISYKLRPGRNVIGRKAQKSQSDIQIDTAEKRLMSREHLIIDIKKVPAKGFVHYISLFKEKVNKTFVGNDSLLFGDCLILSHGDIIKLPDATLRFEIPDEETTEF